MTVKKNNSVHTWATCGLPPFHEARWIHATWAAL